MPTNILLPALKCWGVLFIPFNLWPCISFLLQASMFSLFGGRHVARIHTKQVNLNWTYIMVLERPSNLHFRYTLVLVFWKLHELIVCLFIAKLFVLFNLRHFAAPQLSYCQNEPTAGIKMRAFSAKQVQSLSSRSQEKIGSLASCDHLISFLLYPGRCK